MFKHGSEDSQDVNRPARGGDPAAAGGPESGGTAPPLDFIREIVAADVAAGKHGGRVATRFPPEPNGYLHIGHAKSIALNFGIAAEYGGLCNLRFDDTNPFTEDIEYVEAIQRDVRWLGFDWQDRLYHASDYFEQLYEYAVQLVRDGKAYVCSLSEEEIRRYRGTVTQPGVESPYRHRSPAENLDLFARMRAGEFPDGAHVLRARIDMASPNMKMRDPLIYRIRHARHYRSGDAWCIYPMYDYAHPLSDALERITHSLCTLEFENNREIYDWFVDNLPLPSRPRQIEFARLNLSHTVLSKRRLLELVQGGLVDGWDDPRMPTLCGLRRRGYTPQAIRAFCERIGLAKRESVVDAALLEFSLREDLNLRAPRVMAVLRPLKVVLVNYPEGQVEEIEAENNPEDPSMGKRRVPFSGVLWLEREDFREAPPKGWFRLAPGREVRLKHAYYIRCLDVVKDERGEVSELRCTYDPESRGGSTPDGRTVRGTLHWVSAAHARGAEVRLYDHLFLDAEAGSGAKDLGEGDAGAEETAASSAAEGENQADAVDWKSRLNPGSLTILRGCKVEPGLAEAAPGAIFQFMRQGYFCADSRDSRPGAPVFNRAVGLRDSWAKVEKARGPGR